MLNYGSRSKKAKGFTLIEVMVSLFISTAIIGGTLSLFLATKKTQRFTNAVAEIQQSGSFALNYLKREIRMVGYQGCLSYDDQEVNVIASAFTVAQFEQQKLIGYEVSTANWEDGQPFNNKVTALTGTDAFSIGRITDLTNSLTGPETKNANVKLDNSPALDIAKDDLILISDCSSGDLFRVINSPASAGGNLTLTHSQGGNSDSKLSKIYLNSDAVISTYQNTVYFIDDTGRQNPQGDNVTALFRAKSPLYDPEELVEGVENMQILYGETLATGNTRYVPADQTSPAVIWDNVKSLKVSLLLASHQGVRNTEDASTYEMLNVDVITPTTTTTTAITHSGGRRLKKVFSLTTNIRNRME